MTRSLVFLGPFFLHLVYPVLLSNFDMASRSARLGTMLSGETGCWQPTQMCCSDSNRAVRMPEKTGFDEVKTTPLALFGTKTEEELTIVTETVSTAGHDCSVHHQQLAEDTRKLIWDSCHDFRLRKERRMLLFFMLASLPVSTGRLVPRLCFDQKALRKDVARPHLFESIL